MGKPRVHQLAKELGIPAAEAMRLLAEMGDPVRSASGTITPRRAQELRETVARHELVRDQSRRPGVVPTQHDNVAESGHPSARAAQIRKALLSRSEPDWSKFGFSDTERTKWLAAGVPEDKAHLAAIARESSRRDQQSPRIKADTLRQECREGERVIDALIAGTNAIRVEERLAKRRGQRLRGVDEQLMAVATTTALPAEHEIDERVAAFHATPWTPKNTPRVADQLLQTLQPRRPRLHARAVLGAEASRYTADRRIIGPLLSSYARAHGVYHAGPELDLLCSEGMDSSVLAAPKTLAVVRLIQDAVTTRNFYFLREDAHSALSQNLVHLNHVEPGARAGIGLVESSTQEPGVIIAWSPDTSGTTRCVTLTKSRLKRLLSGKDWGADVETYFGHVGRPGSAAAVIAGLTTPEVRSRSGQSVAADGTFGGAAETRLRDVVLHYRSSSDGNRTSSTNARSKPDHRWLVRGHYRRQWKPSTQSHSRIWIEEHESGPVDKPLLLPERVIVRKGPSS